MSIRRLMTWLLFYILLLLAAFLLQRKMLYFPARFSEARHAKLAEELGLKPWPSEKDQRGLIAKQELKNAKGTVLVFHGNAGAAIHRGYFIEGLHHLGYRVILAEYPGYGSRSGTPSETSLIDDGIASSKLALREFPEPLFLCGESLGSGVVSGIAASKQVPIKGLLLITPFDSMTKVAQHHYWYLLARWLILDRYDNVSKLEDYPGPAAMLVATRDEIVPNSHSIALFDRLPGKKRIWRFENAGHNTLPLTPNQPWWREVMTFLDR